ncbi:MAG: hypothetical protein A3F72_21015 [Bacteroidetes bacterium RIFCSPLOWO2_12_FULL_35_15]|nr:MAG: hypothetical protein A3F72_21015 [Bacteroidetes bacterium RIFCSPLOWO2_12_FULL_35_15]
MKSRLLLSFVIALITNLNLLAQQAPELVLTLLSNDKIADVNIDQENYIKYVGKITDLTKSEFKDISENQKVAILLISHKTNKPTIEFYSNPKISAEKESKYLKELDNISVENTKLVDFPILITLNEKNGDISTDFKELVLPDERINSEYENADLKKKYELNKVWAAKIVLPVLSAYETMVDEKFTGVKNFGKLVTNTNFDQNQNSSKLTSNNPDFWRANLEMSIGNQLIPITKIFVLISQGEFDHANKYLEMVQLFSSKSISNDYLKELSRRISSFNKQLNSEIEKGIVQHDKANYDKAISVYNSILDIYPNSAWANYELFYSQNALDLKNGKIKAGDRTDWDNAKIKIFKCNPLYNMDVRASNGREGYLLFRRQEISGLFKTKEEQLKDVFKYADIAMDLGVYDFAAQLFWFSTTFDKGNEKALFKFLFCVEQLGVTNLKNEFKGDFEKEFKKIEEKKTKEMKESKIYKSFKNG